MRGKPSSAVAPVLIFLSLKGRGTAALAAASYRSEGSFMVTNYPQQLAAAAELTFEKTGGALSRMMTRMGQVICGWRGHDAVLHFEGKRVMMRCTSCGHDTPGWEVNERAP